MPSMCTADGYSDAQYRHVRRKVCARRSYAAGAAAAIAVPRDWQQPAWWLARYAFAAIRASRTGHLPLRAIGPSIPEWLMERPGALLPLSEGIANTAVKTDEAEWENRRICVRR
jgi:hypothetical protein